MTTERWPEHSEAIEPLGPITVRVPATSANLGTGFDAAGVALQRYATVTVSVASGNEGERSPMSRHVRKAVREVYRELGRERPESEEIEISVDAEFPLGRGLGAERGVSRGGSGSGRTRCWVLRCRSIGCWRLGRTLRVTRTTWRRRCSAAARSWRWMVRVSAGSRFQWRRGLRFVGFTPSFNMSTKKGRALLPNKLSRKDAVHNSCRSALLVAALTTGSWDVLKTATDDRLHQIPRSKLFPTMFELFEAAESAGAYAAYLSGGGSTLMALTSEERAEDVREAWVSAAGEREITGQAFISAIDSGGAQIL